MLVALQSQTMCRATEHVHLRRLVLRLGFKERLSYHREKGLSNPKKSFIFNMLEGLDGPKTKMVRPEGKISNELFETLADCNDCLEPYINDLPELMP